MTLAQIIISCEFYEIFKDSFFIEPLRTAASGTTKASWRSISFSINPLINENEEVLKTRKKNKKLIV